MRPLVDVVMPARDAAPWIGEAIRSLIDQRLAEWRLFVVDDGSTDHTPRIARRFTESDSRIHLLRTAAAGPGAARNAGIDAGEAPFVAFLDADDRLFADALHRLLRAAESAEHGAAFAGYERRDPAGHPLDWEHEDPRADVGLPDLLRANVFPIHTQIIARATLDHFRFDPDLPAVEDWDLWLRLAESGVRWTNARGVLGAYRQRPASRSSRCEEVMRATSRVLDSAFARAAALGWAQSGADLTPAALHRTRLAHALDLATTAALNDQPPDAGRAASVFRLAAPDPCCLHDSAAAEAALWLLPAAEGAGPGAWPRRMDAYAAAAARWWRRCEAEGWGVRGFADRARHALAGRLAPRRIVAEHLADAIDERRPVVLHGLGRNGRLLAALLNRRGLTPLIRDDHLDDRRLPDGLRATLLGPEDTRPEHAQHIVTRSDDRATPARTAPAEPLRWAETAHLVSASLRARFDAAWNAALASPALAGAA